MEKADGLVPGSPVYIDQVRGQMKIFIDLLADAIHNQVLGGRYGCSIATTFISGESEVVACLDHVIHYLGAITIAGLNPVHVIWENDWYRQFRTNHGIPGRKRSSKIT